jgi:hypothetical protein
MMAILGANYNGVSMSNFDSLAILTPADTTLPPEPAQPVDCDATDSVAGYQ